MKATAIGIEEKTDRLIACLDTDIQHLQEGLSQLDELRRLVIKRDDAALGNLLEKIQMETDHHQYHQRKRQALQQELAAALGYDLNQMTISAIEALLPKERKDQVADRKEKIRSLLERFKKEHLGTAMLLSECARFNNMLLKSIFDLSKAEGVCYNSNGKAKRQTNVTLVNLQL